jgi:hypothetical protein
MEKEQARSEQEEIVTLLVTLSVLKKVGRTVNLSAKVFQVEQLKSKSMLRDPKQEGRRNIWGKLKDCYIWNVLPCGYSNACGCWRHHC